MSTWSDREVKALLAIWGESKIQQELDGAVRNKVIFTTISKKLQEKGYTKSWDKCRNKIKNLKKKYRQVKDHNNQTGRGRATCKFFDTLDSILGHRPASAPSELLDSSEIEAEPLSTDTSGTATNMTRDEDTETASAVAVASTEPSQEMAAAETDGIENSERTEPTEPTEELSQPKSPKKSPKKDKKTRAERATERLMENFTRYQKEADEAFQKKQDERWQRQFEAEEQRRREERDHELHVLQMLMGFRGGNYYEGASSQPSYYSDSMYEDYS